MINFKIIGVLNCLIKLAFAFGGLLLLGFSREILQKKKRRELAAAESINQCNRL